MKALLQRVGEAQVWVEDAIVAEIGAGLLAFIGIDKTDDAARGERLARKLLAYRIFADDAGRMNRSVVDVGGSVLLVPQFTLSANTRRGLRPSFDGAMAPPAARDLFAQLVEQVRARHTQIHTGVFGADMRVALVNDGPVTFLIET